MFLRPLRAGRASGAGRDGVRDRVWNGHSKGNHVEMAVGQAGPAVVPSETGIGTFTAKETSLHHPSQTVCASSVGHRGLSDSVGAVN